MKAHIQRTYTQEEFDKLESQSVIESNAMTLWVLHDRFGFGKERLRQYWDACREARKQLKQRYDFSPDDYYMFYHKLKEYGIDVAEWTEEVRKNESKWL